MPNLKITWDLLSKVLLKERILCEACRKKATESHHIIHRNHSKLLYLDEKNILCLCHSCHSKFHGQIRHAKVFNDIERHEIIQRVIGDEGIEYLRQQRQKDKIWTDRELKELRKEYRQRLKN